MASSRSTSPSGNESVPVKDLTEYEEQLIEVLNIDKDSTRFKGPASSTKKAYQRYLKSLDALAKIKPWTHSPIKPPTKADITGLYVGTTQYNNWNKVFDPISSYRDLANWLLEEDGSECPSDTEVWQRKKPTCTLKDLEDWVAAKKKGKAKANPTAAGGAARSHKKKLKSKPAT